MFSLIDMMAFETRKTINIYEESQNQKILRVILVGGLVNMPHFANYFKEKLGRDALIGNPMARVVYPQGLTKVIPEISSTFAVATGLAMRDL